MTIDLATGRATPILVEYADWHGVGFKLIGKVRRGELTALQDAATSLLKTAVGQPQVDTGRFAAYGQLHVTIAGRRYWCFHVQGRRGPFGPAGTCQFVFADSTEWPPGDLWRWCQQRCAEGPFRESGPQREAPAGGSGAVAQRVLRELAAGRARIALALDPEAAGALVTGLLQVLPPDVVARYWWRTCLLEPPARTEQPVVSGRWPDVLRERRGDQAERIDEWLGASSRSLTAEQEKALGWLADFVAEPAGDFAPPTTVRGMGGLLDWLVTARLAVTIDQVEGLLDAGDPDGRLVGAVPLVTLWARRHPAAVRRHLLAGTGGANVQKALFEGLWTAAVTNRVDELRVPPAATTSDWRGRLAVAMRVRRDGDVLAVAGDLTHLQQAGLAPTTDDDLVAARGWLADLGLTAVSHPQFFPNTLADVCARFADRPTLSESDRTWLRARGDRLPADLLELAPLAQEPWPAAGLELVGLLVEAGRRGDVGPLAEALLDTQCTSLHRFTALVKGLTPYGDDVRRAALRHGLGPLAARNSDLALPAELEGDCIAAYTDDAAAPAQVRHLLRGFADRNQALAALAQEAEDRAQRYEGRARQAEDQAQQHIARVGECESRAQESEGRAQELEVQIEKLEDKVRKLTASRVALSPDEPVPPVQPSSEDAKSVEDLRMTRAVERRERKFRRRQKVALALLLVLALLTGLLAGAILWRSPTTGEERNPGPSAIPTSTVDPGVSLLPTQTDVVTRRFVAAGASR